MKSIEELANLRLQAAEHCIKLGTLDAKHLKTLDEYIKEIEDSRSKLALDRARLPHKHRAKDISRERLSVIYRSCHPYIH